MHHPLASQHFQACQEYDLDIKNSVAYANSIHDLALLASVGQAIAVTPDRKLRQIAHQRDWEIIG